MIPDDREAEELATDAQSDDNLEGDEDGDGVEDEVDSDDEVDDIGSPPEFNLIVAFDQRNNMHLLAWEQHEAFVYTLDNVGNDVDDIGIITALGKDAKGNPVPDPAPGVYLAHVSGWTCNEDESEFPIVKVTDMLPDLDFSNVLSGRIILE